MNVRSVLDNHPLVLLVGVAVASGAVVAGVMSFLHEDAISRAADRHGREVADLQRDLDQETGRAEDLARQLDARTLAEKFKSLHARVLTFASVNPECQPFDRGFGEMLIGADWNLTELASEYRAAIEALEGAGLARVAVSRAGPKRLAFAEGDSWPIADPMRCARN